MITGKQQARGKVILVYIALAENQEVAEIKKNFFRDFCAFREKLKDL